MSVHNPFHRDFVVIGGSTKTTGGSLNLQKGAFALVNAMESSADGAKVLANVDGISKRLKALELRLGVADKGYGRSHSNKPLQSMPFSLENVVDLRVSAPETTEQIVDELIVGYNGIDDSTAFSFNAGDAYFRLTLELEGDPIAYRGANGGMTEHAREFVSVNVEIPSCDISDTCGGCDNCNEIVDPREIVLETIERLKRHELAGGQKVENFVEITPVIECDTPASLTEIPYDFYCLELCDAGTDSALSLVAAQYDAKVERTDRVGATSTYQMMLPRTDGAPADYSQTIASIIKGCDTCPAGFTATSGGVLYAIEMEDGGADQAALVQALPGAVAASATKEPGSAAGIGFYTVILDDKLTDAEVTAFLGTGDVESTASLSYVGELSEICENGTVTNTAWAQCGSCNVIEEEYQLTLPDDQCGNDRLAELNQAYTETVTLAESATDVFSTITLTGTSGTANINIAGVDYLVTFNTDLATTAVDFDTAHSATLAALGIEVRTDGDDVIIEGPSTVLTTDPTITNVSGDLAGTVVALAAAPLKGGCQTGYSIKVITNMVCDECDDIFKDYYTSEAPEDYDGVEWKKVAGDTLPSGNCKTGIRFKGKTFMLNGELALRDMVQFVETSTKVRVSAGYPNEVREGMGNRPKGTEAVTQISRWQPRTHLAGNLDADERQSVAYYLGQAYREDYLGRQLRGEITNMEDQLVQYVHYVLQVRHDNNTQGFGGRVGQDINYGIFVEVGRQGEIEAILNSIATNAGIPPVKAF